MNLTTPYVDITDANEWVAGEMLDSSAWDDATETQRLAALRIATRAIDNLRFRGRKTLESQEREFPRNGSDVVPNEILVACILEAYQRLDGRDAELEQEALGNVTHAYSTVRSTSEVTVRKDWIRVGIMSADAWNVIRPFLADPLSLDLLRVN